MQTLFTDDLDGGPAEDTVRSGLDGTEHEIDLNADYAQALRGALAWYVVAARRAPAPGRARHPAGEGPVSDSEVCAWAKSQGIEVKERGRMPAELVARFKAAIRNLRSGPSPLPNWLRQRVGAVIWALARPQAP